MENKLKYPIKYAAMPIYKNSEKEIDLYIPCKTYLISKTKRYKENGSVEKEYEVVFVKELDNDNYKYIKNIPAFNFDDKCINSSTVSFICDDYYEINKYCENKNRDLLSKHLSHMNINDMKEEIDNFTEKKEKYNILINDDNIIKVKVKTSTKK